MRGQARAPFIGARESPQGRGREPPHLPRDRSRSGPPEPARIPDRRDRETSRGLGRMNSSVTVAADLDLRLVVPEHGEVPLTASLYYRGDDPYAIRMAFHVGTDDPVEWIFARDLLAVGLDRAAGDGDVRVWPSSAAHRDVLNISLSSPFGQAHFEAPLTAL